MSINPKNSFKPVCFVKKDYGWLEKELAWN